MRSILGPFLVKTIDDSNININKLGANWLLVLLLAEKLGEYVLNDLRVGRRGEENISFEVMMHGRSADFTLRVLLL